MEIILDLSSAPSYILLFCSAHTVSQNCPGGRLRTPWPVLEEGSSPLPVTAALGAEIVPSEEGPDLTPIHLLASSFLIVWRQYALYFYWLF